MAMGNQFREMAIEQSEQQYLYVRTVYIGSLMGTTIPFFRSPVAGLPMVHWK